jgi:hypothetical protein
MTIDREAAATSSPSTRGIHRPDKGYRSYRIQLSTDGLLARFYESSNGSLASCEYCSPARLAHSSLDFGALDRVNVSRDNQRVGMSSLFLSASTYPFPPSPLGRSLYLPYHPPPPPGPTPPHPTIPWTHTMYGASPSLGYKMQIQMQLLSRDTTNQMRDSLYSIF